MSLLPEKIRIGTRMSLLPEEERPPGLDAFARDRPSRYGPGGPVQAGLGIPADTQQHPFLQVCLFEEGMR